MPVSEAHPDAVKLDEAFAAAMDTPGRPREPGPPPETDKDAPFGRDEDGNPLAPFGLRKDGKPKLSAAGRKAAEDQARIGDAPPKQDARDEAKKPQGEDAPAGRYAAGIAETLETFWLGGTVAAEVGPKIPVVGRFMPAPDKLHAQAAVLLACKDQLAGALDICAQHNDSARKLAEKLSSATAGWALNAAFMILPFVTTSVSVWGKQEREFHPETGQPLQTLNEQLAEQNRTALDAYMAKLKAQAETAAAAAQEPDQAQAA